MKSYRLLTDELLVSVGGRMRHGVNNIRGIKTGRVLDANKFNFTDISPVRNIAYL